MSTIISSLFAGTRDAVEDRANLYTCTVVSELLCPLLSVNVTWASPVAPVSMFKLSLPFARVTTSARFTTF